MSRGHLILDGFDMDLRWILHGYYADLWILYDFIQILCGYFVEFMLIPYDVMLISMIIFFGSMKL